jgi:hypothetical protein
MGLSAYTLLRRSTNKKPDLSSFWNDKTGIEYHVSLASLCEIRKITSIAVTVCRKDLGQGKAETKL